MVHPFEIWTQTAGIEAKNVRTGLVSHWQIAYLLSVFIHWVNWNYLKLKLYFRSGYKNLYFYSLRNQMWRNVCACVYVNKLFGM